MPDLPDLTLPMAQPLASEDANGPQRQTEAAEAAEALEVAEAVEAVDAAEAADG